MAEVTQRLAACADDVAVATELRAALRDLASIEDHKAALDDVVAFVTASENRWITVTQTFISDFRENALEDEIKLKLLDALLVWIVQEKVQKNHKILGTLLQFFQLAIRRLGGAGDMRRWLKWGDHVLDLVYQTAALLKNQESFEAEDEAPEDFEGLRCYVVKIATLLMQLRNKIEGDDDVKPDLKTMTFIWKVVVDPTNLAKLATAFGPTLASVVAEENDANSFSVNEVMVAVMVSVECSAGQLLRVLDGNIAHVSEVGVLKFLKLYWRAFQRLIVAFTDMLECELENCVLVIVNVTATFLYAAQHSQIPESSKTGYDLRALLDQAVEIAVKLARSTQGATSCQTRASIRTLLWHPAAEMVRAVGQRQPSDMTTTDVDSSIQWSHLLILTAFAASESNTDGDTVYTDSNRAIEVSQLFQRYRECALTDLHSRLIEVTELFMDLMLGYFFNFEDIAELQLTLLKQTLYPDWMQRTLCWEIWRELLCFCWDEVLAVQALQMLVDITQWDDSSSDKSFVLASGVIDEVLQLTAFVYTDMPLPLQDVCMDQVTAVIDVISSKGPGHHFNQRVASQLHLLEKLVGVRFLHSYNGLMKDEWAARYLPICFECCGTILDLLSSEEASTTNHGGVLNMIRVLDMCLLVLRGVFDDSEPRQDGIAELSVILVRMSTEALSQLAKHCKQTGGLQVAANGLRPLTNRTNRSLALEKAGSRCIGRAVETSLYVLTKLGPVLKSNKNNQCVQVMKDLLAMIDSAHFLEQDGALSDTPIITARFVDATLFDLQVAGSDTAVVWQLVLALFQKLFATTRHQTTQATLLLSVILDALYKFIAHSNVVEQPGVALRTLLANEFQPFRQSVSMWKLAPDGVAKALETAESSTLQSLKRSQNSQYRAFRDRFPDEPAELYAESDQFGKNVSVTPTKRSADNSEALPQKRHKITHFVSLCREVESLLSSMEDDKIAAKILSGKELEDATTVLHKLLAKTITLCP
ncbi:unnamed protein product [Peronospora effusa]|uniref:Uncharacterized protein n=1 Tax=Peronospora effusa TaxID=542832 RepID=A0A3M6V8W1_9STRA|nr:hypothetical protein DD238_008274 [Peronospora effusa]RQM12376.1 hypothetical protein DD237_008303 [Peronospora effusa]CAI5705633.1 unnamed protein product [Peronospora effusa]